MHGSGARNCVQPPSQFLSFSHKQEARLRQELLRQHFEAELKQQQLQLKGYRGRGRGRRAASATSTMSHLLNGMGSEHLLRSATARTEGTQSSTSNQLQDAKAKRSNDSSDSGSDLSSLDDSGKKWA